MAGTTDFPIPVLSKRVVVIVGGFGSGKSEVAVNLARHQASSASHPVAVADLDIINPYFRSREAAEELTALGIELLIPHGDLAYADLPIIIPEIKGAIKQHAGPLILDVGGDDLGATVLRSLLDAFSPDSYDLLLTHNANRPFTSDVQGTIKTIEEIEAACQLKFTGIISNTHLMEQTTPEVVLEGLALAREVGRLSGLPIAFLSATPQILKRLNPREIDCPVLPLDRSLLKPWERKSSTGTN